MKTPDLMPEHRAQLPRCSHVLSHDFGFTCTTGHLLPVFHTFMNPGEKIKLGFDFNLRTMQLEAAAFADLVTHVEYFFVPIQLLYQPFENIVYDIRNQYSSLFDGSTKALLPLIDMPLSMTNLYNKRANSAINDSGGAIVESIGQSSIRLLDMLGFNPIPVATSVEFQAGSDYYLPNIFPYQLMAYHCIYQYYYRLDTRERFNSTYFNFDSHYTDSLFDIDEKFFLLHYRPLRNDYFTDIKVSPIVDVLNLNDKLKLETTNNWLSRGLNNSNHDIVESGDISGSQVTPSVGDGYLNSDPSSVIQTKFGLNSVNNVPNGWPVGPNDLNTANIRAMFANEKLWSITGRAKKTYDDQTLAHFGFKVPHDVKHEITCFGKDEGRIHVGEVISTANTELSPLGEIAGKGYGSQSGIRHSFVAPCHGVVMAIFSVECVHNYDAGLARENMVASKFDFFIPEYDHLGMQPMFGYELGYSADNDTIHNSIVGWQYRYEHWKRRYNRTTGVFRNNTGTLKSWIPTFSPLLGATDFGWFGKTDNQPNTNSFNAFLNLPQDVNQLFFAQYPRQWSSAWEGLSKWSGVYDNDPFVVNSKIDCVLVSEMSDYSLPRLDS